MTDYSTNLPEEIKEIPHKYLLIDIDPITGNKIVNGNKDELNWDYEMAKKLIKTEKYKNCFITRKIDLTKTDYFVFDVDYDTTEEELYKKAPFLEDTCCVKGTTKGFHFYFRNAEIAKLKTTTKIFKYGDADIITGVIFEKDGGKFNHNIIYDVPTSEIKTQLNEKGLNWINKQKLIVKENEIVDFKQSENGTINDVLNSYFKVNANWSVNLIGEMSYKIMCDSNMCLVDKKTNHKTEEHSCLYVNKKSINTNCFSHENKAESKELHKTLKNILKIDDDLFISIVDFEEGTGKIFNVMKKTFNKYLRFLGEKIWVFYEEDKGLWRYIPEPASPIQYLIRKYLDASLRFYTEKPSTDQSIEAIKKYTKYYKTISGTGFITELKNIMKYELFDEDFENKLDDKKYHIAFKNGLYDVRTKKFRDTFKYDDYLTQTLKYDYSEERNKEQEAFVREQFKKICNYKESNLDYLLSVFGYSLLGDAEKEKSIYSLTGQKGNNGKTTILDVLTEIMPCYVAKTDSKVLEANYTKKHKFMNALRKRIAWCDEFDKKAKVDVKMMKEIADGKKLSNEVMYGTSEQINVRAKMFIIGNHTLNFDNDGGSANRYKHQQFDSHFGDYETDNIETLEFKGDKDLPDKLKTTYALDLIWILLDYGNKYCDNKKLFDMPIEFKTIAEETIDSNNKFKDWFEENIKIDNTEKIFKRDMMEATHGLTFKEVKDELRRMGYKYDGKLAGMTDNDRKKGGWTGIKFKEEEEKKPVENKISVLIK